MGTSSNTIMKLFIEMKKYLHMYIPDRTFTFSSFSAYCYKIYEFNDNRPWEIDDRWKQL
jgi:hypothetical protein